MVHLSRKKIKGKTYTYVVKSIRLPDGKGMTLQKLIQGKPPAPKGLEKEFATFFLEKEKEAHARWAVRTYGTKSAFSEKALQAVEGMKLGYRELRRRLSREQLRDVFDRFTANFTYESNAIEGSSLMLKDVAIVMFDNRTPEGKDLREIYETRNSREVVDKILAKKFAVTEADIIKMHSMLMEHIDTRTGYKQFPNQIVGADVQLTLPEKVPAEMKALIEWFDERSQDTHPLQLAALFHGKFEKIHPFADGNGRVGRFIANATLVNAGYPPLIIRKTQRDAYIKTLQDFQRSYTTNLERLFLEKYKDTYWKFFEVYVKYLK